MGSIDGLRLRIKKFVLDSIKLAKEIPKDEVGRVFVNQYLRSTTSIGANFEEATQTETTRDLVYKLSVVKKEARETAYWLDLICESYVQLQSSGKLLMQECEELIKIIASIIHKKKLDIKH